MSYHISIKIKNNPKIVEYYGIIQRYDDETFEIIEDESEERIFIKSEDIVLIECGVN